MYDDEMRAEKWDGLSLWRRSAAVVIEYDGNTVLGLMWDALSRVSYIFSLYSLGRCVMCRLRENREWFRVTSVAKMQNLNWLKARKIRTSKVSPFSGVNINPSNSSLVRAAVRVKER